MLINQHNRGGGPKYTFLTSTSIAGNTTSPINTTGADLIIFGAVSSDGDTLTFSDNKGNSWSPGSKSGAGWMESIIAQSVPSSVGIGHTFSISGGSFESIYVFAFSGSNAAPVDQSAGATGSVGANALNPGSITPSVNNSLIVSLVGLYTGASPNPTLGGLSPQEQVAPAAGITYGGAMGYAIQTAKAATTQAWAWANGIGAPAARIASFKPA